MAQFTNNSGGPKAITTTDQGVVVLKHGESADLNVAAADAAAIKKFKLLDAPEPGSGPMSIAELQKEIASTGVATTGTTGEGDDATGEGDDGLPPENDSEVAALKDSGSATDLRAIAKDEGVTLEGDDNKTDIARKIVAARRSA